MHIFSNLLGIFVFDEHFSLADKMLFEDLSDYKNKEKFIETMKNKHKNIKVPNENQVKKILLSFKNKQFYVNFCNKNLQMTRFDVKNSVKPDTLLVQSISLVDELDKAINIIVKRLREWYGLHNPEFSMATENHKIFVGEILEKEKDELLKALKVDPSESIGADFKQEDLEPIRSLCHQTYNLYQLKKDQLVYISALMDELCPNIKAVCGNLVGANLIRHAGSLRRLSEMPASTVQILGAENALFRHIKTGAKPPRHGIIVYHPLLAKAPDKMHGKIARALADKISIAAKVDYFQGKFIGNELRAELEKKFREK